MAKQPETKDRETGEDVKIPVLRYFNVFHASQCDGLGENFTTAPNAPDNPFEPIERCEQVASALDRP